MIWMELLGYFGSAIAGGFGGWLFGRKKYNTEVEGAKIQNFDAALEAYKKMYEDIIKDLKDKNQDLRDEVESLKAELTENRKQIITLTNFVLAAAMKTEDEGGIESLRKIINNKD